MTTTQYLAANRFGLGQRHDEPAIAGDVREALIAQLYAFEPAPKAIASLIGREAIARALVDFREAGRKPEARHAIEGYYADATHARLAAAVASNTSFPERLTYFWANHFAISADDPNLVGLAGNFEFEAIRPHIMGKFSDLLIAAVRHPAMLLFLDQTLSLGPDSPRVTRIRGKARKLPGLNENLGREILELHTLGVRSGYTQTDVTAFSKALTGLTVSGFSHAVNAKIVPPGTRTGDTMFIAAFHQPGAQTILGKHYPDTGAAQAEAVLRDLAVHPATARHIATEVARHFTADVPPPSLVDRLAKNFTKTGGDLPSLYRTLVASPEPWQGEPGMFKSPWDWTVSMLRGVEGAAPNRKWNVAAILTQLGQPIWKPGSPAGYGDKVATWAGSAALMRRVELASRYAGQIGGSVDARKLAPQILADALDAATRDAIARADSPGQGLAILFASPAFLGR